MLGTLTGSRSHRMEYSGNVLNSLLVVIPPKFWVAADYIPSAGVPDLPVEAVVCREQLLEGEVAVGLHPSAPGPHR